jgi:hypothetical protein
MRVTVGELRSLIRETVNTYAGSRPEESYEQELADDPLMFEKDSVLVPKDVKKSIKSWMKQMGLAGGKKKPVRMS